jgi:multiple sugar transport system permease protein
MTTTTLPRRRRTLTQRDARTGLALISPTLIIVLAAVIFPLLWSVLISFQHLRLIEIGVANPFGNFTLDNFARVLGSGALWSSLGTTVVYTVGAVVLSTFLGLLAAMALRKPFRGRTLVRAALLLPYVAPIVAVTFVWRIMLNPQFGIINEFGQHVLGWSKPIAFLSQTTGTWDLLGWHIPVPTALLTVIVFEGWRYFPFAFLFIMARLEAMSHEPEEAALVDGAGPFQAFRYIVWPQLLPVIGLLVMLRTIWTFNDFDDIFLLSGGAAGTQVASVRMYQLLTVQQNVGAASAQSVVMSILLILMLGIYLLILRRRGERV